MNTTEALARFEKTAEIYLDELECIGPERLLRKKNEEEWSIGQLYGHLIRSALEMHLRHVETCLGRDGNGDGGAAETGEISEAGRALFARGSLPPEPVRVPPSPAYTPSQPKGKEELAEGLRAVAARMRELEPRLGGAEAEAEGVSASAIPHPRFGAMNARQWFCLVEMHYRHHLRQLERLNREAEAAGVTN